MKTATITLLLCVCTVVSAAPGRSQTSSHRSPQGEGAPAPAPALAQTAAPSTEKMIEQLRTPRTRSLRNLQVEAVPALSGASAAQDGAGAAAPVPPAASQSAAAAPTPGPGAVPGRPTLSLLILFDFDSARVRPESQQALSNLSQALQSAELRDSKFAVEGHTDARGGAAYNQKLSALRAQAVRAFLKAQGVDEDRLMAVGKGATELVNTEQPFAAENRRVLIVNLD